MRRDARRRGRVPLTLWLLISANVIAVAVVALALVLAAAGRVRADVSPLYPGPAVAPLARVIDGDTIRVRLPDGSEHPVRLLGFDTPELHQPRCIEEAALAADAKRALAALIGDGPVRLDDVRPRTDRYGRTLARVLVDVSDVLIASQLARPYDGGARRPWCDARKVEGGAE